MSFARVGVFQFRPGTSDEVIRETQERACEYLKTLPGFLSYCAMEGDNGRASSFSVWEQRSQAEDAARRMTEWIQRSASSLLSSSDVFVGEITVEEERGEHQPAPADEFAVPEARH